MILLYGIMEDAPMALVRKELDSAHARYCFLDHHHIFHSTVESDYRKGRPRTIVHAPGLTIDLSEVTAAYTRPYNFRDYAEMEGKALDDALAVAAEGFEYQFTACLETTGALVINRSGPSATNNSKPYQLSLIENAGFKIPDTFITNDPAEARKYLKVNPDCIYKSISGIRSIVHRVSDDQVEHLDDVKWCPVLFQKLVPGTNYRVHVIKEEIFTARIESDQLDYRYGNTRMWVEKLPVEIAQKCFALTSALGLTFSGIDLMRTPDDEWYCFEVNPAPGYSYFQLNTGLPISTALARALMGVG